MPRPAKRSLLLIEASDMTEDTTLQSLDGNTQAKRAAAPERKRAKLAIQPVAVEKPRPVEDDSAADQLPIPKLAHIVLTTDSKPQANDEPQVSCFLSVPSDYLSPTCDKENQDPNLQDDENSDTASQNCGPALRMYNLFVQSHQTCVLLPEQRSISTSSSPNTAWDTQSQGSGSQGSGSQFSCSATLDDHTADAISQQTSCTILSRRSLKIKALSVEPTTAPPVALPCAPAPGPAPALNNQQQQLDHQLSQAKARHGWFAQCRGCAQMTGHEYSCRRHTGPSTTGIPFCAPCSHNMRHMDGEERMASEAQLLFIHNSWRQHGL